MILSQHKETGRSRASDPPLYLVYMINNCPTHDAKLKARTQLMPIMKRPIKLGKVYDILLHFDMHSSLKKSLYHSGFSAGIEPIAPQFTLDPMAIIKLPDRQGRRHT